MKSTAERTPAIRRCSQLAPAVFSWTLACATLACHPEPASVASAPSSTSRARDATELGPSSETFTESAPKCSRAQSALTWLSLYGAVLGVPEEWRDETEYAFSIAGERKRHMAWSSSDDVGEGFAADRHAIIVDMAAKKTQMRVTAVRTVHSPAGELEVFETYFGDGPNDEALALAVLRHQPHAVLLNMLATRADVAKLPEMFESLTLQRGLVSQPGSYSVYDLSFRWPQALQTPQYFSFRTAAGTRMRLQWLAEPPALEEVEWSNQFSFQERDPRPIESLDGSERVRPTCAPLVTEPGPLTWTQLGRSTRGLDYQGRHKVFTFAHAYAPIAGRFLALEFFDESEGGTLERFRALQASIHATRQNP